MWNTILDDNSTTYIFVLLQGVDIEKNKIHFYSIECYNMPIRTLTFWAITKGWADIAERWICSSVR